MGLPQDDPEAYKQCSPVTFAKNLQGNLLYVHGTGDDNVHYKNAEVLINELVRQQKIFQVMIYPTERTRSVKAAEHVNILPLLSENILKSIVRPERNKFHKKINKMQS